METMKIFNYNNSNITFKNEDGTAFVNATEMARNFGKQPVHWLNQTSTNDYLSELSKLRNRSLADLVVVTKGGNNPGTWMHEDVALEFSRWLSPAFSIWCNDRIKELLRHGATFTTNALESIIADPTKSIDMILQMATAIKEERQQKEIALQTVQLQTLQLQKSASKVEYVDQVLQSSSTYVTDQIAKELGTTAVTLNKKLAAAKIIFRRNGQWVLTAPYSGKGYTKSKTYPFTREDGTTGTNTTTVWTEQGRQFLHSIYARLQNNIFTSSPIHA